MNLNLSISEYFLDDTNVPYIYKSSLNIWNFSVSPTKFHSYLDNVVHRALYKCFSSHNMMLLKVNFLLYISL